VIGRGRCEVNLDERVHDYSFACVRDERS